MEGAQAGEVGPCLLELYVAADDVDDIGTCDKFLDE
jgi:hypothetical protein